MQITETDIVNAKIEYGGKGVTTKEITQNILNEWRNSKVIADMKEAQEYSLVKNTAIDMKTRNYEDEHNHLVENKHLSNVKTKTSQYRKSLLQKLDFCMAKPFIVTCDDDKYKEEWDNFLNSKIRGAIKRTSKEAINKGIGFSYPWIDEKGELQLTDLPSQTLYPAWKDEAHTELDAAIRDYKVTEYINQTPSDVYKVEYWDKDGVEKFIDYSQGHGTGSLLENINGKQSNSTGLIDDLEGDELREGNERVSVRKTHMIREDGSGLNWDKVPFIYLKGNDDELPLLNECKADIDAYDMTKSKGIDSILDDIDATLVVEGIGAEMGELSRARKLVQNSRIMVVDPGGSAHFEKVNSDISAIVQQLDVIRKDIQDNTATVDVTTIALGSNPSGAAMKTFYEPLNIWANGFEEQFRIYFDQLKYFFDMWLSMKGNFGSFEELQKQEITVTLDRDMLIDEAAIIQNLTASGEMLSEETKLEMHPYVQDVEQEKKRLEEDKKKQQEEMELMQFQQQVNNPFGNKPKQTAQQPTSQKKPEKQ